MLNFVIEVYRLHDFPDGRVNFFYRCIPTGSTFTVLHRNPDFIWKGRFKPGYSLGLDYPVQPKYGTYIYKS